MLEEICEIKGLEIYTPKGIFLGYADEYAVDTDNGVISGIMVNECSPVLADSGVAIKIPYRWVQSVGDVIILNTFPEHIGRDGTVE